MRFPRMTTRRWMVAVALVSVCLGLRSRRLDFERLAAYHDFHSGRTRHWLSNEVFWAYLYWDRESKGPELQRVSDAGHEWHVALSKKYARAARYPWLPAEPDPPKPE